MRGAGRRVGHEPAGDNLVEERTYGSAPWLKTLTVSMPQAPPSSLPTMPTATSVA